MPQSFSLTQIPRATHLAHLRQTITLARQSPPKPTNFRVGCVIVSYPLPLSSSSDTSGVVLSTGFTLELPGNTHAEQCALAKLESVTNTTTTDNPLPPSSSSTLSSSNDDNDTFVVLYTSLEPCGLRLSGADPCVQRILATRQQSPSRHSQTPRIDGVIFGAKEPGTFVKDSQSCRVLSEGGVAWEYLDDYEGEILAVAMEGHKTETKNETEMGNGNGNKTENENQDGGEKKQETRIDDISVEERKRQEALPRNPKKRMMEGPAPGT